MGHKIVTFLQRATRRGLEVSVRLTFPACDGTEPRATTPLTIRLFPFTDVP